MCEKVSNLYQILGTDEKRSQRTIREFFSEKINNRKFIFPRCLLEHQFRLIAFSLLASRNPTLGELNISQDRFLSLSHLISISWGGLFADKVRDETKAK